MSIRKFNMNVIFPRVCAFQIQSHTSASQIHNLSNKFDFPSLTSLGLTFYLYMDTGC